MTEPEHLSFTDEKRPDGLTVIPWKQGKSLTWDFTCKDTLASSFTIKTSQSAGLAANIGEEIKNKKYEELTHDFDFTPIAVETMGSWGSETLKFLKELGSRIDIHTGNKRATSELFQSLGMIVQKGNAASMLGTLPSKRKIIRL